MLQIGTKGSGEALVTEALTARALGSGELPVYATPAMLLLVEETAWKSVAPALEPGQGTVGTKLEMAQLAATPVGRKVRCETILTEIDRRRLVFSAMVWDEAGKIGEGAHERFIVDNEKFLAKANAR